MSWSIEELLSQFINACRTVPVEDGVMRPYIGESFVQFAEQTLLKNKPCTCLHHVVGLGVGHTAECIETCLDSDDLAMIREKLDYWRKISSELNEKAKDSPEYPWDHESILRAVYRREANIAAKVADDLAMIHARLSGEEFTLLG